MKKNVKSKAGDGFEKTKIKRVNECRGELLLSRLGKHGGEDFDGSRGRHRGTDWQVKQGRRGMGRQTNLEPLSQPGKHAWLEQRALRDGDRDF